MQHFRVPFFIALQKFEESGSKFDLGNAFQHFPVHCIGRGYLFVKPFRAHIVHIATCIFLPLILPCNGPCFDRPSRRSGVSVSNFPRTRASRVTLAHCGHCRRAVSIQPSGLNHFNEFPRAGCTIIEKILLFHCFHESAPSLHGSSNKSHNGSNTTPDGLKTGSKCPTRVPRRPRHAPQKILVRGLVLAVLLVVVHRPCVALIKIHAVGAI